MQGRPQSECGRAVPGAGEVGAASSAVRRSYNSLDALPSAVERGRRELEDRGPRRPRTTPKPRVQRLLLGPSQEALYEYTTRSDSPSGVDRSGCFMTHLPDSPPKPKSVVSPRSTIGVSRRAQASERSSVVKTNTDAPDNVDHCLESPNESVVLSTTHTVVEDDNSADTEAVTTDEVSEHGDVGESNTVFKEKQEETAQNSEANANEDEDIDQVSSAEEDEVDGQDGDSTDCSTGPFLADIDKIGTSQDEVGVGPEEDSVRDSSMSADSPIARLVEIAGVDSDFDNTSDTETWTASASADDEYAATLAERQRVLEDASDCIRLRSELEGYLESLKSLRGEDGEAVVEFPKNYNQILALMTEQDIRVEDASTSTAGDKAKPPSAQQNWARVLIQTGLSKQQAFGNLEDEDGDARSESGLASKIALKMAQIRQLDAILEEKLGKNLYKAAPLRTSKKPERNQESDGSTARTFMTQASAPVTKALDSSKASNSSRSVDTVSATDGAEPTEPSSSKRKDLHFVRRNKEVVANGMRANMTRAEEARLSRLLEADGDSDESKPKAADDSGNTSTDSPKAAQVPNEFAMDAAEKAAIAQLLASKPDLRRQAILAELEDAVMLDDIPEEGENKRPESKRQRLRLNRIDQELRFLEETPSIAIVCDDDYVNGDYDTASEADSECRSERSFRTVTSAGESTASSMCSTRSGVISRRQFSQFVAEQKAIHHSAPTASCDDIRRLLGSISRLTTPAPVLTPPVS